ncbi:hypothetical protein V5E97_09915 [Singulisphaera sp. Ch08]|uniref:Uncharacterized protein n=1 Tax=Singulisphaera sp. Ch08 TaxID=3120278 RepID=A0AAU7CMK4_9BACT
MTAAHFGSGGSGRTGSQDATQEGGASVPLASFSQGKAGRVNPRVPRVSRLPHRSCNPSLRGTLDSLTRPGLGSLPECSTRRMTCGQSQCLGGPVDSLDDQFGVKALSDKLGYPLGQTFHDIV